MTHRTLAVDEANVFSVLRTWLYTDADVALRELVSNAADAVAKRRALAAEGCDGLRRGLVEVVLDTAGRTLTVSDDGLGMTIEEADRYLSTMALSGATEAVGQVAEQQAGHRDDGGVIGRFGVGFYSAFMLADRVSVHSRSHREGAVPARWAGTSERDVEVGEDPEPREGVGTTVVLELTADCPYLEHPERVRAALLRWFRFLRAELRLRVVTGTAPDEDGHERLDLADPPWRRPEREVSDEEWCAFSREHVDPDADPVAWIRLESLDLGLRGVLFVRDARGGAAEVDGHVDVYSRGVFVERDPQDLVPRFVGLLSGVVECDALPLVLARSGVRTGEETGIVHEAVYETLIQHVTLALHAMATNDREHYERLWPHLCGIVKYGVLTDRTFASVMARAVLFEDLTGSLVTLAEHVASAPEPTRTVYYTSDTQQQAAHLEAVRESGGRALVLDHALDLPLVRWMESAQRGLRFVRVDAGLLDLLGEGELDVTDQEDARLLADVVAAALAGVPGVAGFRVTRFGARAVPALLTAEESVRRVGDLRELYGVVTGDPDAARTVPRTLVVNLASPVVREAARQEPAERKEALGHLIDLALLLAGELPPERLPAFLTRSTEALRAHLCRIRLPEGPGTRVHAPIQEETP